MNPLAMMAISAAVGGDEWAGFFGGNKGEQPGGPISTLPRRHHGLRPRWNYIRSAPSPDANGIIRFSDGVRHIKTAKGNRRMDPKPRHVYGTVWPTPKAKLAVAT